MAVSRINATCYNEYTCPSTACSHQNTMLWRDGFPTQSHQRLIHNTNCYYYYYLFSPLPGGLAITLCSLVCCDFPKSTDPIIIMTFATYVPVSNSVPVTNFNINLSEVKVKVQGQNCHNWKCSNSSTEDLRHYHQTWQSDRYATLGYHTKYGFWRRQRGSQLPNAFSCLSGRLFWRYSRLGRSQK